MNLSEERTYQKLLDALDAMELSKENYQLAEQYLDMTQEEKTQLLTQTEHQDFSGLDKEKCKRCTEYVGYLNKRNRREEVGRFVRFAAAVGGATAYYVLVSYGWDLLTCEQEFLTREQKAAIRAEGMAWNSYTIKWALNGLKENDPKVLKGAMDLCYHKNTNTKVLLAGIFLHYTKPVKNKSGFLSSIFSKEDPNLSIETTVKFLENTLVDSIPDLFGNTAISDGEIRRLQAFVKDSKPKSPFPQEISDILSGKMASEYLITLLVGAAFLAIDHSDQFTAFIRLTAAIDKKVLYQNTTLDTCLATSQNSSWFTEHMRTLEDNLPISKENYVLWCLMHKVNEPLTRAIKYCPDAICHAAEKVSVDVYQDLMNKVKVHNPALYQKMNHSYSGEFREKLADELANNRCGKGQNAAKQYLLGETELDTLYPFVNEWRNNVWDYDTRKIQKIQKLKSNQKEQKMYRRAVVLEALCMRARYFCNFWYGTYREVRRKQIVEILELFEEEQLPIRYQIEALSAMFDSFYREESKTKFINECVEALRLKMTKKEWKDEFYLLAKDGSSIVRSFCIRVLDIFWEESKDVLLSCAMDSSKQVRELLVAVYKSHKESETDIKNMLTSKKSQEREIAVLVLKKWGVEDYRQELEAALAIEKSKKIKELLQSCLGIKIETKEEIQTEKTTDQLAKEILKGGKKRKISWVWEVPLPQVHKLDGALATEDYLSAILVAYADMSVLGVNADAVRLAKELNAEELSSFVCMVFGKWLEGNAESKKKWVLYAASIHGGEPIIPMLHAQIQEWPKVSRGAMAAEAVRALALNGSSTALLLVDQLARKFKFRQVKNAAAEALTYAANQLGITRAELEDRIVPNLGFDDKMERIFDYGTRKFKVLLNLALELEVYDENGKKLKNLPAPAKKDNEEQAKAASDAFKLLKKQLKTVVTNQKLRLDQAMSTERMWEVDKWKALFVQNPVMHQFAMGLIWGLYKDGELTDTFRYMEDGTFNTVDEEEYELLENGLIGLVHPIELKAETLSAWKEQLSDYEVIQPIEQLERPVYEITAEEKNQTELTRFGGKLLNGLSLSGKLQGMGWYRGSVLDAGWYCDFYREDGKVGVELAFSGCHVGGENEEITVYGAQFYKVKTMQRGSYVRDAAKEQNQYKLGEISPRYFSEIVLQLTKATASSQEQLAYPECKKNR